MSWIKICGITNMDDALAATAFGADAIGVVLEPSSPRFVPHDEIEKWLPRLPRQVKTVAVFGRFMPASVVDLFDMVQCFDPPVGFLGKRIEARRPEPGQSVEQLAELPVHADFLLLDAYSPHAAGGTGTPLDATLAAKVVLASKAPVILAGGLNEYNVQPLIQQCRPYGVDVSSGVEASPGKKDHAKLRNFILAARSA